MNNLVKIIIAGVTGSGIGLFGAQYLIDGSSELFKQQHGVWKSWPEAGAKFPNPYARAHFIMNGRLPLSRFEADEHEATTDSDGETLDADCTYKIAGKPPATRRWSLYIRSSAMGDGAPPRSGLTSEQMIYDETANYRISISKNPQTGNWIVPPDEGRFTLILRMYNPTRSITNRTAVGDLPKIKRVVCR